MHVVGAASVQALDLTTGGSTVALVAVFVGCVLSLVGLWCCGKGNSHNAIVVGKALRNKPKDPLITKGGRRCVGRRYSRRLSYTSANLLHGSFPASAGTPETVMHAMLCFRTLPSRETLIQLAKKLMRSHERCGGIPVCVDGDMFWRMRQLTEEEIEETAPCLVRTKEVTDIFEALTLASDDSLKDVHSRPLDAATRDGPMELPWWEFLILKNTSSEPDALHAVVLRFHHGLGDGLSMVGMMQILATRWEDGGSLELKDLLPSSIVNKLTACSSSSIPKKAFGYLKYLSALLQFLTLPKSRFDDPLCFRKSVGPKMIHNRKRVLIKFPAIPLSFIKSLKDAADVGINDILMACLSQVIHDYCKDRGDDELLNRRRERLLSRALLSVALPRPLNDDGIISIRNKWVMQSVEIGVGHKKTVLGRVKYVSRHIQENIKESPRVVLQLGVQEWLQPRFPSWMRQQTVYDVFVRHSLVVSNVPGPNVFLHFGGQQVVEAHNVYNNILSQAGFLTYAGSLYGNFMVDPEMISDAKSLPVYFCRALCDLGRELQVEVPGSVVAVTSSSTAA